MRTEVLTPFRLEFVYSYRELKRYPIQNSLLAAALIVIVFWVAAFDPPERAVALATRGAMVAGLALLAFRLSRDDRTNRPRPNRNKPGSVLWALVFVILTFFVGGLVMMLAD